MKTYKLLESPLNTTLKEQRLPHFTALPSITINDDDIFSPNSETTSLPAEIIMPKTSFGDPDSRLKKEEIYINL
jgi:hypothetical protein